MKNVMVANDGRDEARRPDLVRYLRAQIDNSLRLGWEPSDLVAVTSFPFSHGAVAAREMRCNDACLTGSKTYVMHKLLRGHVDPAEAYWAHDLDCWQCVPFEAPEFKAAAFVEFRPGRLSGGSAWYRAAAIQEVWRAWRRIVHDGEIREEPTLNLAWQDNPGLTVLNHTWNLGTLHFQARYEAAEKPIKVAHFHPERPEAWALHVEDSAGVGYAIPCGLKVILEQYFEGAR